MARGVILGDSVISLFRVPGTTRTLRFCIALTDIRATWAEFIVGNIFKNSEPAVPAS